MKIASPRLCLLGLCTALVVVLLDQASKQALLAEAKAMRLPVTVTSFFSLTFVRNRGVSFGMFSNAQAWMPLVLTCATSLAVVALFVWLLQTREKWMALALGFIIGGATGNIADRLHYGAVTDFLDFHLGAYHWPAFNVADSAIFIGVVILVGLSIYSPPPKGSTD